VPRRFPRRLGALTALALAAGASCLAAPTTANAGGLPVLALSCTSTTYGFVGQPVTLSPLAVIGTVKDAAAHTEGLPDDAASRIGWDFGPKLPFTIGTIGKYSETRITGAQVADAVLGQVKGYSEIAPAPDAFAAALHKRMDKACGLTAHAWNGSGHAPTSASSPTPPQAPNSGSGSHTPAAQSSGSALPSPLASAGGGQPALPSAGARGAAVPRRSYSGIPAAIPGGFAASPLSTYGQIPGRHAPKVEMLGSEQGTGVQAAGRAEALGGPGRGGHDVGLPMLLAVLALAGVTGALLRTWVLRKSAANP
jgi:hypothetical protein